MRAALAYLFERETDVALRTAVRDPDALKRLRIDLTNALDPGDRHGIPAGDRGDNLIMALIAQRLKFPRPEAEQKLERNLQLRGDK